MRPEPPGRLRLEASGKSSSINSLRGHFPVQHVHCTPTSVSVTQDWPVKRSEPPVAGDEECYGDLSPPNRAEASPWDQSEWRGEPGCSWLETTRQLEVMKPEAKSAHRGVSPRIGIQPARERRQKMRPRLSSRRGPKASWPASIPVEPHVAVALPVPCGAQAHGCARLRNTK